MMEMPPGSVVAALACSASTSLHASEPKTPRDPTFKNARLSTIRLLSSVIVDKFSGVHHRPEEVLENLRTCWPRCAVQTRQNCGPLLCRRMARKSSQE